MKKRMFGMMLGIAAAAAGCAPTGPAPSVGARALTFIEDDWTRALAEARERQVPLFVEAWAPW